MVTPLLAAQLNWAAGISVCVVNEKSTDCNVFPTSRSANGIHIETELTLPCTAEMVPVSEQVVV
jgi:hypothetical protein